MEMKRMASRLNYYVSPKKVLKGKKRLVRVTVHRYNIRAKTRQVTRRKGVKIKACGQSLKLRLSQKKVQSER